MLLPDAFTLGGIAIALFLVCTQAIFLGPKEDQVLTYQAQPPSHQSRRRLG